MELNDDEEAIISKANDLGGQFKVYSNIKKLTDRPHKKVLKSLREKEIIEMVTYGEFKLTEKGENLNIETVCCQECGRTFPNPEIAEQSMTLKCSHEKLSQSIDTFLKS